jgi:hypothetical protein
MYTNHPNVNKDKILERAIRWMPYRKSKKPIKIVTDTTDFFQVQFDDVVEVGNRAYLIRHNAKEGRFGLDDEVKQWVKRAIDLETEESKILKLVFHERFIANIGCIEFECFRSPKKEARILDLVKAHPNFMHGFSVKDEKGNLVRILDYIYGQPLSQVITNYNMDHHQYFLEQFPSILNNFVECIDAIRFLHDHGEKHGDIRRDHIFVDRTSNVYRWIDFDYNYRHRENIYGYDLFGLGNILMFLAGKGDLLLPDLKRRQPELLDKLNEDDVNIVFRHRVANLKKAYPYIPERLNRVIMHFSLGANWYYEHTSQMLEDLRDAQRDL